MTAGLQLHSIKRSASQSANVFLVHLELENVFFSELVVNDINHGFVCWHGKIFGGFVLIVRRETELGRIIGCAPGAENKSDQRASQ